jgi:hypothetical protein
MKEAGTNQQRITLQYFDGINSTVQQTISSKTELFHAENARATLIGVIEKREGQVVLGTNISGGSFIATGNYGLAYFEEAGGLTKGLLRISSSNGTTAGLYYLDTSSKWTSIASSYVNNLTLNKCDFASMENSFIIVNGYDNNMILTGDIGPGLVVANSSVAGSMFNSPKAKKVATYKSRIYLADYFDTHGNELKTTVLRSSYPMGIVSLLNGDVLAADSDDNWVFPMTDTKYFYITSGMNEYEVYRGNIKIADVKITDMTETSITAIDSNVSFQLGYFTFLSSDEFWIKGTYSGEKQYRWISNSTMVGRDIKQYDTFRLVGGDEDAITLLEPVGNVLLIANKNSIMSWNDYTLETFDNRIGCVSPTGYVKRGAIYFIHYTGMYVSSGGTPMLISRKIEKYIKGATKSGLENAAAGYKGLSIFCTIGDVTLYNKDGSTYKTLPDVCIEYATAEQNWYIHTNVIASAFKTFIESDGRECLSMTSYTETKNSILGNELIRNGSFEDDTDEWTLGTSWTSLGGGVLTCSIL